MTSFWQQQKAEDQLLKAITAEVQGVLGQLQLIAELLTTHKTIAPVEDLKQKIKKACQKIKALLNTDPTAREGMEVAQKASSGIDLEHNPFVQDLGGMPLEEISAEWRDEIEGTILDTAELENLVNKKLKSRLELANKLKNKLNHQLKSKPAQALTPKFNKIQETLKYIMKEMPPPPAPTPRSAPLPRPDFFGG